MLLRGIVRRGEVLRRSLAHSPDLLFGQHTFAHQPFGVEHGHGRMIFNLAVQDGLGIARVVAFVVAVAAVADHIDDHVFLEPLAIIEGDLRHADGGFGIVAIDVEDGGLHAARYIRGVGCGPGFIG